MRGASDGQVAPSVAHVLLDAVALGNKRPLEDDTPLLVPLGLLSGKLVDPAQLGITVLARHVSYHVPACQHHPVLDFAVVKVHHFVEKERSAGGSGKPCADQFVSVGEDGVAAGAGKESRPTNVVQKNSTHASKTQQALSWIKGRGEVRAAMTVCQQLTRNANITDK